MSDQVTETHRAICACGVGGLPLTDRHCFTSRVCETAGTPSVVAYLWKHLPAGEFPGFFKSKSRLISDVN